MRNYNIYEPRTPEQEADFELIVKQWGFSSVKLKEFLNKYYQEDLNYASKGLDFNIAYILPYKANGFMYGKMAVDRLKLAMRVKIILMNSIENCNDYTKFVYECLRLFLRVDSKIKVGATYIAPIFSFKDFEDMIKEAYNEYQNASEDADIFGAYIEEVQEAYFKIKPKRKKTKYHYTEEDFIGLDIIIQLEEFNRLIKVYDYWISEGYEKAKYKANKEGLDDPVKLTFQSWKKYMQKYKIIKQERKN